MAEQAPSPACAEHSEATSLAMFAGDRLAERIYELGDAELIRRWAAYLAAEERRIETQGELLWGA